MKAFNDHIIIEAKAEKGKSKDGLSQVFELMKSLTDLQEQIEKCIESQEDPTAIEKIQAFDGHVDDMYQILLDIAGQGVKSIRKRNNMDVDAEDVVVEKSEGNGRNIAPKIIEQNLPSLISKPSAPIM